MKQVVSKSKIFFSLSLLSSILASPFAYGISAVSIGQADANAPAAALTAETSVDNPAGLTLFDHPVISISNVFASDNVKFNGTATNYNTGFAPYTQTGSASNTATGELPAVFAIYPLNDRIVSSIAIYSPFSGSIDFDDDSIVRYELTNAEVTTINISPSIGIKLTPQWSVGLGLDAQRFVYNDSSQQYDTGIDPSVYTTDDDLTLTDSARSWGFGWHGGLLYQLNNSTRFGASYTSKITQKSSGSSKLTQQGFMVQQSDDYNFHITFPAIYRIGAFHEFNNRWQGMWQVRYVTWGVENEIDAHNIPDGEGNLIIRSAFPVFRNTWGTSIGINYKIDPQWLLRGGAGIDQSPTRSSSNQQLSSPSGAYETVGAGAHYQITKMVGVDGGYTHIFMNNIDINNNNPSTGIQLTGKIKNNIDAVGLQITWNLA